MDKDLAVIICNYNKKKYILNCIASVLEQTYQSFDLYVVDNGSDDGSVAAIQEEFRDLENLTILANKENLGGSGGFNTGLRTVLERDYEFVMLVDNDIVMDANNIENLVSFLKKHPDVGMVGSKIYKMDEPDEIQDFGSMIDFENLCVRPNFANQKDRQDMPSVQYCDYVPACSLLTRTDTVRKIGMMPEENFIYWDDMEWGWKFNLAGCQVASIAEAKVWHKGGTNVSTNTFQAYYMYRNKISFFAKYYRKDQKEKWIEKVLDSTFRAIYACHYTGRTNRAKTIFDALLDVLSGKTGKAEEYKIRPADAVENPMAKVLCKKKKIAVWDSLENEKINQIISAIEANQKDSAWQLDIYTMQNNVLTGSESSAVYSENKFLQRESGYYDAVFVVCSHIFEVSEWNPAYLYVDGWNNLICSEADFKKCREFSGLISFFEMCFEDRLSDCFEKENNTGGIPK